jgi:hypothetical protein
LLRARAAGRDHIPGGINDEKTQERVLTAPQQIDTDGNLHDIAP